MNTQTVFHPIFHTGGALPPDYPHYVLRRADQAAIRAMDRGKPIYTIAPRQMGKTSLLKRLSARLKNQGRCCCFVDLATLRNLERPRWFRHVCTAIACACEIDTCLSSIEDQLDFRTFLLNNVGLGWSSNPVKMALLFDEVEGLLGLNFSDEFLMTLRDLYQQRDSYPGQLLIAFAGSVDPEILVEDSRISPFNVAEEIVLDDFTVRECQSLTSNLKAMGVPVVEAVHGHIYEWTAGQPHLTQRICEIIEGWVETKQVTSVSTDVVDRAVNSVLLNPLSRDQNIKHVLGEIANLGPFPARLWKRLLACEPVYSTEAGFYALYLTGAVTEASDGRAKTRNRIYKQALAGCETVGAAIESAQAESAMHLTLEPAFTSSVPRSPSQLSVGVHDLNYSLGLEALKAQLDGTNRYNDFGVLEARLLENLHDDQIYGSNERIRSDRARIIAGLNHLALDVLGIGFNDLSLGQLSSAMQVPVSNLSLVRELGVDLTPSDIEPPMQPRLHRLPFNQLSWEQFEALCAALIEANPLTIDCHLHGVQGDEQEGIDIVTTQRGANQKEIWAYQCKRYGKYTPGKLKEAMAKLTYQADYYVLVLSIPATAALRGIADEKSNVFLWDANDIARKLKNYPRIVEDFFGNAWRDAFCG